MNNLLTSLKKFFSNKNTVTIIGVLAAIVVLYIGYNMRIDKATEPVNVPYAIKTISPGVKITSDMVGTKKVASSLVWSGVITNPADVIGKYSNADSVIPAGSMFFKRTVVLEEQLPAGAILKYPTGYVLYNMPVTTETTYGNSMFPGNYIDIYLKAVNKIDDADANAKDKIMVGKLLENVKVLAVLDSNGDNVFANLDEKKTPTIMIFAVPEEYHILLRKASYLRAYETTLIPVPTDESLADNPGDITLSSEELKAFINKVTVWTDEATIPTTE